MNISLMKDRRFLPHNSLFSNPLSYFLGKHVLVEAENLTVDGRLIRHQLPNGRNEKPHRPFILILGTPIGKF